MIFPKKWYFCAQASFKIHLLFDKMLYNILKEDKLALVILISNKKELHDMDNNLLDRFSKSNIDLNRVVFINKLEHHQLMTMYQHSDVVLDSYFFGGDTTTREAFEIGAPIITLPDILRI